MILQLHKVNRTSWGTEKCHFQTDCWSWSGAREQQHQQRWSPGPALTWMLLIQFRTATKEHSAVMSYITRIPSAFRKYCLVMLRNLSPDKTKGTLRTTCAMTRHRMGLSVSAGSLQGLAAPVHDVSLRAGVYTEVTGQTPPPLRQARQPWVSRNLAKCMVLRKREGRPL